jgi:hypothetical protein
VHYYEDGNVRLTTRKPLTLAIGSGTAAADIVRHIAAAERKYQEELNRGFQALSEDVFKGLRRQLPVTRQKVEWEKIGSYRVCICFSAYLLSSFALPRYGCWDQRGNGADDCIAWAGYRRRAGSVGLWV